MFRGIKVPRSLSESDDKQASAFFPGHCGFLHDLRLRPNLECGCPRGRGRFARNFGTRCSHCDRYRHQARTINIERAIIGSNEGQRDFEALRKKLEPKQSELKAQNDELESLQKQLQTQGDKLNEEARATLVKQIETKKKSFDRSVQDAQEDAQNQQKENSSAFCRRWPRSS